MKAEDIIYILEQDIKHHQLLNNLNQIGVLVDDRYISDIDLFIAKSMGHQENIPDAWMEVYHCTMLEIEKEDDPYERARDLYRKLLDYNI